MQAEFTDAEKTIYDGTEVSGSEVLNAIRRFSDDTCGILVNTKKDSTFYNYSFDITTGNIGTETKNDYKLAQNVESDKYINPTARFSGTVIRDVNGAITGLMFEQE